MQKSWPNKYLKEIVFYIICLVLLVVGIFYDKKIAILLVGNKEGFLYLLMKLISFLGTWFFVLVIASSFFLWKEHKRRWILPLWLSMAITALLVYLLKLLIMRERPETALELSKTSSFPSGHASAVFSTLAILDKEFPRLKWFWLIFAVLVSYSRLYLGMHYLTDVVIGALIGYIISLLIVKYWK